MTSTVVTDGREGTGSGSWQSCPPDQSAGYEPARQAWRIFVTLGILNLIGGGLAALIGLARPGGVPTDLAILLAILGLITMAIGIVQLALVFYLRRRAEWSRKGAMAVAVLGAAVGAYNLISSVGTVGVAQLALPAIGIMLNLVVVYRLVQAKEWFRHTGRSTL